MIREILENNGMEAKRKKLTAPLCMANVEIDNFSLDFETYTKNQHNIDIVEYTCREYVKANGFKLSWLVKYLKERRKNKHFELREFTKESDYKYYFKSYEKGITEYTNREYVYLTSSLTISTQTLSNFRNKIIAWLYANDVKILNDLEVE